MASLTDKFAKSVQKVAVASKPVAISRPPVPVKQPAPFKPVVNSLKKALPRTSAPTTGGQPRATSAVDIFRNAQRGSEQNRLAFGRAVRGAVGGVLGGIGRSAIGAARGEVGRWADRGPLASISLPFRAIGGAVRGTERLVRENIVQPVGRGAVTLVGSPLVSLAAPKFQQVPLQPRGPLQQYLLGSEPILPTERAIQEGTSTANALGFTPEAARFLGPGAVLGGAALDILPDPGDLAKGVAKRGVREAAETAAERVAREEAGSIAERGLRRNADEIVESVSKRAAKKLDSQASKTLDDVPLQRPPVRRAVGEVVDQAPVRRAIPGAPPPRVVARAVDEVPVPKPSLRTPKPLVFEEKTFVPRFENPIDEVIFRSTDEKVLANADEIAKTLDIPKADIPRVVAEIRAGVEEKLRKSEPGEVVVPSIFERTIKAGQPAQPIKKGGKNVIVSPEAVMRAKNESARAGGVGGPPTGNIVRSGNSPLSEARRIVTAKNPTPSLKKRAGDFIAGIRTSLIQEYFPIQRAEKQLRRARGEKMPFIDTAKRFELQAGAQGKAEKDLIDFSNSVVDSVRDDVESFNAYLFLRRTASRLAANPELKKVGTWTPEKVDAALAELRQEVGDTAFANLENVANGAYQNAMDQALRLQVQSGRMSEEAYQAVKTSNDFYAPFKVLKYLEDGGDLAGTGKSVPTTSSLTKAITGIKDDDFGLGNILQESARQIYRSRILAEKQLRMQALEELAAIDPDGAFFRRVTADARPRPGYEVVQYLSNGKRVGLEISEDIAKAVSNFNPAQMSLVQKALNLGRSSLRAGATTFNLAFQPVNLLFADLPTTALFSRYGVKNPADLVRFPLDFVSAIGQSFKSNFAEPTQLYKDWLSSGAANSTIQRELTPNAFGRRFNVPEGGRLGAAKRATSNVLDTVPKIANAIEESGKLLGFKRGLRQEGIDMRALDNLGPREREQALERLVYEVRNYAGSPDFARSGSAKYMNLLFMFFNARVQGAARDFKRLSGQTGGKEAMQAWTRLGTAVGVPATALALYNLSPENREEYEKIPQWERDNYFMIPRSQEFKDEATGETVREYWRIPKRESVKIFSNLIESFITSVADKDPQALADFAGSFLENVSPVGIEGENALERGQSIIGSTNPLLKVPIEQVTNTDTFRKNPIVGQKYESPADRTLEYKDTTPEAIKGLSDVAARIFGKDSIFASPIRLQSILEGFTAGGITQFLPKEAADGRSQASALPIISRFVRSGMVDESDFWEAYSQAADAQKTQRRENALTIEGDIENLWSLSSEERRNLVEERVRQDPGYLDRLEEAMQRQAQGWTSKDTAIQALGVPNGERAKFIVYLLNQEADNTGRKALLLDLSQKKILTDAVLAQVAEQLGTPVVE